MRRDSFIIYRSFYEPIKDLSNEDKGILFDAVCNLALNETKPKDLSPLICLAYNFICTTIERDQDKYQKIVTRNRENIGKRWNKEITKDTNGKTGKLWKGDDDNATDTVNTNRKKKTKSFTPPAISEIESYFSEVISAKNKNLDPILQAEKFDAHYGSVGWIVGKNKMSNWRKAVIGWTLRASEDKQVTIQNSDSINERKL